MFTKNEKNGIRNVLFTIVVKPKANKISKETVYSTVYLTFFTAVKINIFLYDLFILENNNIKMINMISCWKVIFFISGINKKRI